MRIAFPVLLAAALAGPAMSSDLTEMTEAEREAFRAEVRAYLLENPEVLVEAITALEQKQAAAQAGGDAAQIAEYSDEIFNDGYSYVGGNPDGDVTVVEFLDYRCGFCKKSHPEVLELLKADANVRFVVKEFPILGEQSTLASRFAIATLAVAGPDAYRELHNALMETNGNVTEGMLRRIAGHAGFDADAVLEEMEAPFVEEVIQSNYRLAQALNITGTPGFIIGDVMIRGYVPLDAMQDAVDDARKD